MDDLQTDVADFQTTEKHESHLKKIMDLDIGSELEGNNDEWAMVPKKTHKCRNMGSPYLDKPVLGQGGGGTILLLVNGGQNHPVMCWGPSPALHTQMSSTPHSHPCHTAPPPGGGGGRSPIDAPHPHVPRAKTCPGKMIQQCTVMMNHPTRPLVRDTTTFSHMFGGTTAPGQHSIAHGASGVGARTERGTACLGYPCPLRKER